MKNKILSFLILLLAFSKIQAQNNPDSNWGTDFKQNISFIENKGQFDGRNWKKHEKIEFAYSQTPFSIFFSKTGVTYRFDKIIKTPGRQKTDAHIPKRSNISELIFADWIGANSDVEIIAENVSNDYFTYAMVDKTSNKTYTINDVKGYQKITYKNLYDNIDVEYTIHPEAGIKYNVIVYPGGDPSKVKLKYTSNHTSTNKEEFVNLFLNTAGQLEINASLGTILEHQPKTFTKESNSLISSSYKFENNILSFNLGDYDHSKTIVIDPWIVSPTFPTSTAVWEVETDGSGNIYAIGGETNMQLKKYNSGGTLQWTYVTPWDTSTVWLGTLATDDLGNSYVTSGVTANMHKVSNAGTMVWSSSISGSTQYNSEWWSITFNCDKTRLIVGGTWVDGIISFDFYAGIFEINTSNGAIISDQTVDYTNIGGFGANPIEVRSIASSKNGKYVFLTHNDVGAITQNITLCGEQAPIYQVDNQNHLGYKCEDYLPATQNGGGLKAIIANENYFYTHTGDQIHRWNITSGALINSVTLTGGSSTTVPFIGGKVVKNSGLAVDNCGNVYAGSGDRVVKFDQNLAVLSSSPTSFRVYDVSVNSNGEVIAVGAQQNNSATNRNGKIESLNMSACAQFASICCDASICDPGSVCSTDAPFALTVSSAGGTFSGPGVNASTGVFTPSVAGVGTHTITYTLPCGSESITVTVNNCTALTVCEESNGNLTVSGGTGPYTWANWQTITTTSNDCVTCGGTVFPIVGCVGATLPCTITTTGWSNFGTGVTVTPPVGATQIQITDNAGTTLVFDPATVIPCVTNPCPTITMSTLAQTNVACFGQTTGSATVSASGGAGPYTYTWTPGNLNGATQSTLGAGTYTVNVVDNNSCPGSTTVTITQPASALSATASATNTGCGASTGTATLVASGGTTSYSYSWSPSGGSGATASNLAAGSYTATVTDQNGCQATASATVNTNGGPSISVSSSSDVSCNGGNDGAATVTGSGGTGALSYSWTPGALTGTTQNSLIAGTYTVTVSDAGGCTNSTTVTINQPSAISLTQGTINPANCGLSDGSASVNVSGGAGGFTYAWSPTGGSSSTANNIPAGTYTVDVQDQNGCSASLSLVVTNIGGPTVTIQSQTDATCFGGSDGSATVSGTGGATPYTYAWSPSGGSGASASNLTAGNYTVAVTDNTGCVGSATVTIGEPSQINITETITPANCGSTDGAISVAAIGGAGSYTYSWTPNGETTSSLSALAPGSYSVTVTDVDGCSVTENYVVPQTGSLAVDATPESSTINEGESVQLNVTGGTTYSWTPTSGLSCVTCSNPIATPTGTTTYIVTGTDATGCTGSDTVIVIVLPIIVPCGDIFIPTVIAPEGSGPAENKTICVYGGCVSELTFAIYNRWGEKVFETTNTDLSECWDGTYKGKSMNAGVFAYKLVVTLNNGEIIEESGNITLVR